MPQTVGPSTVLGRAGFADDTGPADALVAVPDGIGRLRPGRNGRRRPGPGRQGAGAQDQPGPRPPGWPCPRATGTSPCRPPGWSRPTSSRTPRGAHPAASRLRPSATAGPSAGSCTRRWPPTPAGWPTATGARCGSSGRVRTWCASGPKRPPVAGGINADGSGVLRVAVPLDGLPGGRLGPGRRPTVAAVAPGLALEPVPLYGPVRLLRPAGRGVGRGRRPGRLRPDWRGGRRPDRSSTCPSR